VKFDVGDRRVQGTALDGLGELLVADAGAIRR
jgi:hypothetical protein